MAVFPLITLFNKGESVKSFAIIEAFFLVPLVGAVLAYLLSLAGLSNGLRTAIPVIICIPIIGLYGRFVNR
jgi:carbon starvation protein CstA